MLPELKTLLKLQDRDQAIRRITQLLKRIPEDEAGARCRLENDQTAVARAKEALRENEIAMKNLELDIQTRRNSITRLKVQQYETKKNEEFRAMGNEIERYEKEISNLETSEIELMEKADEFKAVRKAAEEALAATQALVDEELAKLAERRNISKGQLDALEVERREIVVGIDEDLLSIYDRLFKKKGDVAIAPIIDEKCQGCHMQLTPATRHKAHAAQEITHCEQCSRILYLPEDN